jgi:hypothetical protein
MEKIVNLSPIPKEFLIEFFKMHGVEDINVVDASNFDNRQIVEAVKNAVYIIGDYRFKQKITCLLWQVTKSFSHRMWPAFPRKLRDAFLPQPLPT